MPGRLRVKHRWRYYTAASGRSPVREFIKELPDAEAAEVFAAMKDVQSEGLSVARHLQGDLYEVRASGQNVEYRVIFASEGSKGRILLGLVGFTKKSQKTPRNTIELARQRLADWRSRGR